jgi:hypothetical protein
MSAISLLVVTNCVLIYPAPSLVHITGMEGRDSRLRKHSILDNNVWALTALKPFTARKGVHFKVSRAFGD